MEIPILQSRAVFLTLYPRLSNEIASLYCVFLTSSSFTEPLGFPIVPPSAMYLARPELSRYLMFSLSISAHVPSTEIIMVRNGLVEPSGLKC